MSWALYFVGRAMAANVRWLVLNVSSVEVTRGIFRSGTPLAPYTFPFIQSNLHRGGVVRR